MLRRLIIKNVFEKNSAFRITGITELAQLFAGAVVAAGDVAVDCTVGNGNDMLFLIEKTGPEGFVYGFDIQDEAISNTRARLDSAGISTDRYALIKRDHAELSEEIARPVSAFMFNLGYLPGSDRRVVTEPEKVRAALDSAMELLKLMGIITVVIYTGHSQGRIEKDALMEYAALVDEKRFRVMHITNMNSSKPSPSIMVIQKTG